MQIYYLTVLEARNSKRVSLKKPSVGRAAVLPEALGENPFVFSSL